VGAQRVIGVDLGGTKILAGVVDRAGTVGRRRATPTPTSSQSELLGALERAVAVLMEDDVAALGFGIPSTIDQRSGRAVSSVYIPLAALDPRQQVADHRRELDGVERLRHVVEAAEIEPARPIAQLGTRGQEDDRDRLRRRVDVVGQVEHLVGVGVAGRGCPPRAVLAAGLRDRAWASAARGTGEKRSVSAATRTEERIFVTP